MSKLRPTLGIANPGTPCMRNGTAYWMILNAVEHQKGLIHGKLHAHGAHCAIGSYFEVNGETALPSELIDEVATVNDSMPTLTPIQRKKRVTQWLKWRLADVGFPGFHRRGAQTK